MSAGGDKVSPQVRALGAALPEALTPNQARQIHARARDLAGKAVGVSGRTVANAVIVMKSDPEAFALVERGETTVEEAARTVRAAMPPTSKRQRILENAAKQNMVKALSQVGGFARGLSTSA